MKEKTLDKIVKETKDFMKQFGSPFHIQFSIVNIEVYENITKVYLEVISHDSENKHMLAMSKRYFRHIDNLANQNYRKGRSFEYRCMNKLRKRGWDCIRSFGSWGPADVRAFRDGVMLYIQCKWSKSGTTKPESFALDSLIDLAAQFGGIPLFAGVHRRRIYFVNLLTGEEYDFN